MQINGKPAVYLKAHTAMAPMVGHHMYGDAFGHPNYEDGTYVRTGPIIRIDGNEVETQNTVYILHVPG